MRSPRPSRICRRREGGWRAARGYRQGERVRAQAQARAIQSARSRHALAARTHGPAQLVARVSSFTPSAFYTRAPRTALSRVICSFATPTNSPGPRRGAPLDVSRISISNRRVLSIRPVSLRTKSSALRPVNVLGTGCEPPNMPRGHTTTVYGGAGVRRTARRARRDGSASTGAAGAFSARPLRPLGHARSPTAHAPPRRGQSSACRRPGASPDS